MESDAAIAAFAGCHHGVFAHLHARERGFSQFEIAVRLELGRWERVYDRVYRIAGAPPTWRGNLLAACWAGGFRAGASHRSAAALWTLAGGRKQFAEITCPRWRRARHDGLIVHESKRFDPIDLTICDGIPVTTPARTLLDLGAVCSPSVVEMAVDKALRLELVTPDELDVMLRRLGRPGRNGAGVLRRVLNERDPNRLTDSERETLLIQVLRRHGFPEPETQYVILDASGGFVARVDAAFPQWKIAIEYDSDEHHAGKLAHRRDSNRRLKIIAVGFEALTVTHDQLKSGGRDLVAAIRSARSRFGVADEAIHLTGDAKRGGRSAA